jgi:hypothetical protein
MRNYVRFHDGIYGIYVKIAAVMTSATGRSGSGRRRMWHRTREDLPTPWCRVNEFLYRVLQCGISSSAVFVQVKGSQRSFQPSMNVPSRR